jgi:DNA-binding cell septation regulator SpoVG
MLRGDQIQVTRVFLQPTEGTRAAGSRVKAFAAVVLNDSVQINNLKYVEASKGLVVAMPDAEIQAPCPGCGHSNRITASYCNACGEALPASGPVPARDRFREVAHPVKLSARQEIQRAVADAYARRRDPVVEPV